MQPIDHESIKQAREVVEKPIDLYDCLNAFTKEEKLGENETWQVYTAFDICTPTYICQYQ